MINQTDTMLLKVYFKWVAIYVTFVKFRENMISKLRMQKPHPSTPTELNHTNFPTVKTNRAS